MGEEEGGISQRNGVLIHLCGPHSQIADELVEGQAVVGGWVGWWVGG